MKKVTIYFVNNNFQMIDSLSMNKVLVLSYWVHKGICVFNVGMILKRGTGNEHGEQEHEKKRENEVTDMARVQVMFCSKF